MKNTIFESVWEFLCPYYCISCGKVGGILCDCCKKYIISGNNWRCLCCGGRLNNRICTKCELPFSKQFYIGERSGLLKELINCYKFQSIRVCSLVFANILWDLYGHFLNDKAVVPLPTIRRHIRERGFDHTGRMVKGLTDICGGNRSNVLLRRNNSVQVGADRYLRQKQAGTAYMVTKNVNKNDDYALVDDIWTTGSSMIAASTELKKAGVEKISIVVLAKSE